MCRKAYHYDTLVINRENSEGKKKNLQVLLCSENVPPQINGIARRVGHYAEGLEALGCDVHLLCPGSEGVFSHPNPWNFTAAMMVLSPTYFIHLMTKSYDIVHVVMPMNFSGIWLLMGYKLLRLWNHNTQPALVISWHCNIGDYIGHHCPKLLQNICNWLFFDCLMSILPEFSDRILTPTKATEKTLTKSWDSHGYNRTGVCYTGVDKQNFGPTMKDSVSGKIWQARKARFLRETNCKYLLLYVGRLSPEKGINELLHCMKRLDGCALWLIGDGPDRPKYEEMTKQLQIPVEIWGYQNGEALYSSYTAGDIFICPSTTETFGQCVNEALASEIRVVLPRVKVFTEAFMDHIPQDAFWEPLNELDMARAIKQQLKRHNECVEIGRPNATKLHSWTEACTKLQNDYIIAQSFSRTQQDDIRLRKRTIISLPLWFLVSLLSVIIIYVFYLIRLFIGLLSLNYSRLLTNKTSSTNWKKTFKDASKDRNCFWIQS